MPCLYHPLSTLSLQPSLCHQGTKKGSAHANSSCIFHIFHIFHEHSFLLCFHGSFNSAKTNKSRKAPCNPQCTKLNGPSNGFDWDANKRSLKNALKHSLPKCPQDMLKTYKDNGNGFLVDSRKSSIPVIHVQAILSESHHPCNL